MESLLLLFSVVDYKNGYKLVFSYQELELSLFPTSNLWLGFCNEMQPNATLWGWGWALGDIEPFVSVSGCLSLASMWVDLGWPAEWEDQWNKPSHMGHLWPADPPPVGKLSPDKWMNPAEISEPWPDRQCHLVESGAQGQCMELWM